MSEQKKKGTKTFVLNDESITNSRGFRVSNSGLDLKKRFEENPLMLGGHDWDKVIGRWTNIRIKGSKLLADADFDLDDPDAVKWANKVENGYLKGASLGFWANYTPLNLDADGYLPKGESPLLGGEMYEASIVSVPANSGALSIKLYTQDGTQLSADEPVSLSAFYKPTQEKEPMTEQEKQDYERLKAENEALKKEKAEQLKATVEMKLSAIPNLSPQQKENLMEIGMSLGVGKLETTLSALNPAISLKAMEQNNGAGGEQKPKTYAELCAMGKEKLDYYIQNEPNFVNELIRKEAK